MKEITKEKEKLIKLARVNNPDSELIPCGKKRCLDECFTIFENKILFWFNTTNNSSTQMLYSKF
jgi:hypothetical protein